MKIADGRWLLAVVPAIQASPRDRKASRAQLFQSRPSRLNYGTTAANSGCGPAQNQIVEPDLRAASALVPPHRIQKCHSSNAMPRCALHFVKIFIGDLAIISPKGWAK